MTYLLDTNVISYFRQASRDQELAAAAKLVPMAIVDEVRVELIGDRKRGGAAFTRWLGSSGIDVREIIVGSPASGVLNQLIAGNAAGKDLGERASIALGRFDPTLTFVTNDKNAAWLALRELWASGELVLGAAAFLRRLFEAKALIDVAVLDDVFAYADMRPSPTWWASWRAGLT